MQKKQKTTTTTKKTEHADRWMGKAYFMGLLCYVQVQKRVGIFRKFDETSSAEEI